MGSQHTIRFCSHSSQVWEPIIKRTILLSASTSNIQMGPWKSNCEMFKQQSINISQLHIPRGRLCIRILGNW